MSRLLRSARNDGGLACNDTGLPSLRGAKRRSNPDGEGIHTGLLRSARNDKRPARNDGRIKSASIRGQNS
ncbi:MAG: hypothetical protein LBT00_05490 [Spirochaetaceae bacterium]|nr:hypothetical protein [Spirochaetaceae bacterium]